MALPILQANYMNKELEKLIDYSLVDGYISDKEKEVLVKKATQQGFDIDELEMILEGKQHERTFSSRPNVDKCPSCGEILKGLSKVCPSCDYIIDAKSKKKTKTLDVMLKKLDDSVNSLNYFGGVTPGTVIKVSILTFLTAGLYPLIKKLSGKNVFDENYGPYNSVLLVVNSQTSEIAEAYGEDDQISKRLNSIILKVNEKTAKRKRNTIIAGCVSFTLVGLIYFGISQIPRTPKTNEVESAEDKTVRLIDGDSIGKAKIAVTGIEDKETREFYLERIMLKEIDSLTNIKNYNAAILLTSKLDDGGYKETRKNKMDSIVSLEVRELIDNKDFNRARERAELAGYPVSGNLQDLIKLSEKIEKDIKKKRKK